MESYRSDKNSPVAHDMQQGFGFFQQFVGWVTKNPTQTDRGNNHIPTYSEQQMWSVSLVDL
jgi:hypothetical protein